MKCASSSVWLTNVWAAPGGIVNDSPAETDLLRPPEPHLDGALEHLEALRLMQMSMERARPAARLHPGLADEDVGVVRRDEAAAEAEGGLDGLGKCRGVGHADIIKYLN